MTSTDHHFTNSPLVLDALRKGANSGSAFTVYPPKKREGAVVLAAVFGGVFGWLGFFIFVGWLLTLRGG